ncbi:MAG TPA: radical SAM protein [Candidatus Copromorpha excrementigallinarum]|uniref:Radical SAM protein n=1 Tax=Candidatus Allocopromorpha excrementigallinarum TaxID=2840742 RepID=A0A9D1L5P2_9FIRM|nr:radical SAM protein [Candidatus Copromorpha excrementigallinarum]
MRYEGDIYRPPSEAYSLLVQVTIGCTHNKCTFCKMYKDKKFRVRSLDEVIEDLAWARKQYRRVERMFLCDGDALALSNNRLMPILRYISENFPECQRVTVYGRATDVLKKSDEELKELYEAGLTMVYIGAESGSDKVLKDVCKGETRQQLIDGVKKIEASGMQASVTFISGLAGKDGWREHAIETGTMISEMGASYVALLTLIVEPSVPMAEDIQSGKFKMLTAEEVLEETLLLLEHTNVTKQCVFRSNHASNYVSLRGNLPDDKEKMMDLLRKAMSNKDMLRSDMFRAL